MIMAVQTGPTKCLIYEKLALAVKKAFGSIKKMLKILAWYGIPPEIVSATEVM